MNSRPETLLERAAKSAGPFLFAISFVVYLITLSRHAFPGESARLIVQHLGIDPFPPMSHFLWTACVRVLAAIPIFDVVARLNLFSALCGATSVWLVYQVVAAIPHNRTYEEVEAHFPSQPVQGLSGIVAASFFAFCGPFWVVSTRAHTASFDVLLLLAATLLLVRFNQTHRTVLLYALMLLYGLGTTEFATFIVMLPVFAMALVLVLWRAEMLRAGVAARMLGCYAAGLIVYLAAAWIYTTSPAYQWRAFTSYFQVLFYMWREQYRTIRFSLPQVGWMLVFLTSVLPALIVVVFPKRATNRSAVWSSNFLHALLALLAILIVFNVPIAPWPLLHVRPLLVTPYLITATWIGYLAGYWFIFFWQRSRFDPHGSTMVKAVARRVYIPSIAVLLVAAAAMNYSVANGRTSAATQHFTDYVLDRMNGKQWLISNGVLDDQYEISARAKGVDLNVLNTAQGTASAYLRYVATLFQNPRLKSLSQVGLGPLMNEWLSNTPGIQDHVAVLAVPDFWNSSGLTPVPDHLVFVGATNTSSLNPRRFFEEQQAFWNRLGPELKRQINSENLSVPWDQWALTHLGKMANNTGVLLEDLGATNEAFQAYQAAMSLDTNNLSALMNSVWLAQRESRPEKAKLEAAFEAFARRLHGPVRIWSLAYNYGYVRNPEMFAQRGWAWAMSGKPNLAANEMQKAVSLGVDKQTADLAVASFYFMQNMDVESERTYVAILEQNPQNQSAILGLARVAMRKGDFDTARGYLNRLREMKAADDVVRMEEAFVEALSGNVKESMRMLNKLVEQNPKNVKAWAVLALLASNENDDQTLEQCMTVLKGAANSPAVIYTLAQVALSRNKLDEARDYLNDVLKIQAGNVQALRSILWLDVRQGDRGRAEEHLERLLSINPRDALGNLVLGSLQYDREEYELAEESYRTSLASERSDKALNDLAWILQRKNKLDEALSLVQEALQRNKTNPAAWDTLGVVKMKQNDYEGAMSALQQALSLAPGNAAFILHVAELYEHKGMKEEALRLADPLLVRPSEMSSEDFESVRSLVRRLQASKT